MYYVVLYNRNAIVDDLRVGDLISNNEKQLLVFRYNEYVHDTHYNIPLFLTAGAIEQCIDKSTTLTNELKNGNTHIDILNQQLLHYCSKPLRSEAIREFWSQTTHLLTHLLGDRHKQQLNNIIHNYKNISDHHIVMNSLNIEQINRVKKSLLDLIRSLRIASASFTSIQLHEFDNDDTDDNNTSESEESVDDDNDNDIDNSQQSDIEEEDDDDINDDIVQHIDTTNDESKTNDETITTTTSKSKQRRPSITGIGLSSSKMKAYDAQISLKSMLRSPSVGTLDLLEKIRNRPRYSGASVVKDNKQREYVILHVNLIREQANALVNALLSLTKNDNTGNSQSYQSIIINSLQAITSDQSGFLYDDNYAARQIHSLMRTSHTTICLNTLHTLLTIARIDAEPKNIEARRRLLFFGNSLFSETLPSAPTVQTMKSWTVLTPFYRYVYVFTRCMNKYIIQLHKQNVY